MSEEKPRKRGGFAANPQRASDAGKKGAQTVKERLGTEHFKRMGKLGGTAVREKFGPDYYREIGKRGGQTRWDKVRAEAAAKEAEAAKE